MATTVQLGKIRYNVRGEWSGATTYSIDDIVTRVGSSYICILGGTNQDPITATTYWTKISSMPRDRGTWSSATTYYQNDIVGITSTLTYNQYYSYQDAEEFICTASSSTNQAPGSNPSVWSKISSGTFNKRFAFLGAANEGYVPPLKSLWNAKSGATTGGVGIVTLTSGGAGYTTTSGAPAGLSTATVTFGGGGTGATGVAYVSAAGTISYIDITNPGSGYSNPVTVTVSGGGTPSATATATAYSYPTRCGMGDTVGSFKGQWHVGYGGGGEGWLKYINRNYGLVQLGYQNATYMTGGNASGSANLITPSEAAFIHLDWLEGVLPTPDGQSPKVIQVEAGLYNTLVLFNNGEVHYAGYNGHGQAGDNTTTVANSYVRCGYARTNKSGTSVLRGKKAIRIASTIGGDSNEACSNYALIEESNGLREIWAWGYNGYGQLGDATTIQKTVPTRITTALTGKIVEIWATGGNNGQLFVLTDQGNMYSCGYNGYGQLGLNDVTNRSSLVLVKSWGVGTSRVEKFVCGGGGSTQHMMVKQENRTLWSWGYNGYGQLGHGHTNNIYAPLTVYTGGYTGSSGANVVGTASGSAVTAWDVWLTGPLGVASSYYASGTAVNSTTAFACGYNGYYNLSDTTTTNRSVFTNMLMTTASSNSTNLTNTIDIVGNVSATSYYNGLITHRLNDQWYLGGYVNGAGGIGHGDNYNIRQVQDPRNLANNYRVKANILWPQAFDQSYIKVICRSANTSSGQWIIANLKTGQLYGSCSDNTYGVLGHWTNATHKFQRLIGH